MSFYRKTLLALFLSSSFLLVIAVGGAYRALSSSVTENYQIRYRSLATTLGETIEKLESGTEDTMRVALQALKYYTADHPIPSDAKLRVMQRNLRVSSIEFVRADGKFIRSTKYKITELPSLFSFCPGYRELFTGESEYDHTPLMPSVVDRQVLKFAMLPTADRRHVINIGTEVGYIGDLFRSVMASDKNLMSLAIYTPSGKPLANFIRSGDTITDGANPTSVQTPTEGLAIVGRDSIEISTPVKATVQSCCECVGKGLVSDPSGKFNYMLRTKVSLGDLNGSLGRTGWTLLFAAALGLLFAFVLSRIIAQKLTARIERINQKTREIAGLKDLSIRFNFTGKDEISNIGRTMDKLLDSLEANQKELVASERSKALAEMARDVAHNIRSPLVAAENAVPMLAGARDEPRRVLANAMREIRVLTDDLKAQADGDRAIAIGPPRVANASAVPGQILRTKKNEKPSLQHLVSLIDSVVTKKRVELQDRPDVLLVTEPDAANYALFAAVRATDLRIALSNLINNAVESMPDDCGTVTISCRAWGDRVRICVADTGRGIPKDRLPQLGQRGATFDKKGGTGIGLAGAREAIEKCGGTLTITSELGTGTEVTLEMPRTPAPEWFLSELRIPSDGTVVILDDDRSIHDLWNLRLGASGLQLPAERVVHLCKGDDLITWVRTSAPQAGPVTYLVDFELLGEKKTGISLIDELKIAKQAVLVTGRFDEEIVTVHVFWLGLKMIPKPLAGVVPIISGSVTTCHISGGEHPESITT